MSTLMLIALVRLVSRLSFCGAQRVGGLIAFVWFHLIRIRRGVVAENLRLALPGRSAEHGRIAREAYKNTAISVFELIATASMDRAEILGRIRCHGLERFDRAVAIGKGVIVVTAHFGNFDLLACSQALRGVPLAIISKELSGQGSNRIWMDIRSKSGLTIFTEKGSLRRILPWLRSGKVLGLVVDQRTGPARGGVLVDFFSQKVWTSSAPARIAARTGASLVPVRMERGSDGFHDMYVEEPIPGPVAGAREKEIVEVTAEINRVVQRWVEGRPGHWMWLHKRFKGL